MSEHTPTTPADPEYQAAANVLDGYLHQRFGEATNKMMHLDLNATGYLIGVFEQLHSADPLNERHLEQTVTSFDAVATPLLEIEDYTLAREEEMLSRYSDAAAGKLTSIRKATLTINHIDREYVRKPDTPSDDKIDALIGIGMIGARHKPAATKRRKKVNPRSNPYEAYDAALDIFDRELERGLAESTRHTAGLVSTPAEERLADPKKHATINTALLKIQLGDKYPAYLELVKPTIAASVLSEALESPDSNAAQLEEHLFIARTFQRPDTSAAPTADTPDQIEPTYETKWTILPPEILGELGLCPDSPPTGDIEVTTPQVVDAERLRMLGELVVGWNDGGYLAVANLKTTGSYDYRVAVLPQELPNGLTVEHAVAETPATKNATFVFRAERGLEDDGNSVWLGWKDVFHEGKRDAQALGARKVTHRFFHRDNVLEYLTRDPADLDRPGYRR